MATHVYALLDHQMQCQNFVDLQQRLNDYSIASRVIRLPCPQYFYPESIGAGHLVLPQDWLRLGLDYELDVKVRVEAELEDLSITDGLGLEMRAYKYLMIVKHYAGEKWIKFILDPIRRLNLRKDVLALANFLGTERVVYLPGSLLPDLEAYTISQLISELQNQKCQFVAVQAVAKQVQSYWQIYQEEPEFCCIDRFDYPVTSTQLQSLANLQLAILALALGQDELDYLNRKLLANKDILQQLEVQVVSYFQWVADVTNSVSQELTGEQLSLIDLLSEELKKYLDCKPFSLLNNREGLPLQELAEKILTAFAWDSLDIDDWIEEQLCLTGTNDSHLG